MRFYAVVGIICLMQVGCFIGSVVGQDDPRMNFTNEGTQYKQRSDSIVLECMGSTDDLSYYITHKVIWVFEPTDPTKSTTRLMAGFYPSNEIKSKFGDGKKYDFKFINNNQKTNCAFQLTINNIDDSDEGTYSCYLNRTGELLPGSRDSRQLVVLNAVQSIKLDLLQHDTDVPILESTSEMANGSTSKLPVGKYSVFCKASESNPAAEISLTIDGKDYTDLRATANSDQFGSSRRYTTFYVMKNVAFRPGSSKVVCRANLPSDIHNGFPMAVASMNLHVTVDKPNFECENASAAIGDRYSKLVCNLTSEDPASLSCGNVHWSVGMEDTLDMQMNEKKTNEAYDTMEATCKNIPEGVQTVLDLFLVKPIHIESGYYVVYSTSPTTRYRHLVDLIERRKQKTSTISTGSTVSHGTSNAQVIQPFPFLLCCLITLVAKIVGIHL